MTAIEAIKTVLPPMKEENGENNMEEGESNGEHLKLDKEEMDDTLNDEDEEESTEYSDSDDDSDDDEEPPILKYSRLTQLPKTFFEKELISSSLITDKIFVFGTYSGLLYITDLNYKSLGTLRIRKSPILSIGFDGINHIIAGSIDGTIIIAPLDQLHSPSSIIAYDLKTPIYSVVLNGIYSQTKSFIYSTKTGEIIMLSLNWLGSKIEKSIYKSDENYPIVKLKKVSNILIFFNNLGIFFMNLNNIDEILLNLKKPKRKKYPSELIWPKLNLQDNDRLIIGWVNKIWSIKFDGIYEPKEESRYLSSAMSTFSKPMTTNVNDNITIHVEYEYKLRDSLIAGIGSFKDDLLMVLTIKDLEFTEPPELRIINCYKDEEISTDEIVLKNYKHLKINDLQLSQFHHESFYKFFLICSYDCIIAEEFSLDDRYQFLLSKSNYLQAWEISKNLIDLKERCNIGIKQVEKYLNENENWNQCSKFLKQVLNAEITNDEDFEFLNEKLNQWSWIFLKSKKFQELAEILPINEKLISTKDVYNEILEDFIENEAFEEFAKFIKKWSIDKYDSNLIIEKLQDYLNKNKENEIFRRCLADLYLLKNEPNLSIPNYIKLKDSIVLKLISKYHLINQNIDKLPLIVQILINDRNINEVNISELEIKLSELINLIVDNRHEISIDLIIKKFKQENLLILNFFILKRLVKLNEVNNFETELIDLYAKYSPFELLNFLKKYSNYNIDEALKITKKGKLHKELVYLLGKIGNIKEAMTIIVDELNDPNYAIEFSVHYYKKYPDIWEIFLDKGLKNSNFIKIIIEYTGTYFNPDVIEKIPKDMEIKELRKSLIRITKDNELNLIIQQQILKILENESILKSNDLNKLRIEGTAVYDLKKFINEAEKFIISKNGEVKPLEI